MSEDNANAPITPSNENDASNTSRYINPANPALTPSTCGNSELRLLRAANNTIPEK